MKQVLMIFLLFSFGCGPKIILDKPSAAERAKLNVYWLEAVRENALPGDWLVVRGYKGTDNLVVLATNIPLSHAAVYDPEENQVIEATGKGVGAVTLEKFVDKCHRILIIRPRWWTEERGNRAVRFARKVVGKKYDFMGTIGGGSKDRWYCSELCIDAYKKYHKEKDHLPRVMEPGQMYLWGRVLHDTGPRY